MSYIAVVLGHDDQVLFQMEIPDRRPVLRGAKPLPMTMMLGDDETAWESLAVEYVYYDLDLRESELQSMVHDRPVLVYREPVARV